MEKKKNMKNKLYLNVNTWCKYELTKYETICAEALHYVIHTIVIIILILMRDFNI